MSQVKDDAKSQGSRKSGKLHSAIEQAQAIQQREQLRVMIVDKFNKDFSKGNKNISKLIEEVVTDYFGKEKVTEQSLRSLKDRVGRAVEEYRRDSKSGIYLVMQKKEQNPRLANKISNKEMQRINVVTPKAQDRKKRMETKREVRLHLKNLKRKRKVTQLDRVRHQRPVRLHLRVFTMCKEMMMTNGLHQ